MEKSKDTWTVLSSEYLHRAPWLTVRKDHVVLPNGNHIPSYYILEYPNWVETLVYPMLERYGLSMENMLRTFYEHAAWQISRIITARPLPDGNGKLLITGGGAFNKFLIERIDALCPCEIVIPSRQIIEYKEALIFAFLGALYMADTPGCLASVTGATTDNIGGMLFKI